MFSTDMDNFMLVSKKNPKKRKRESDSASKEDKGASNGIPDGEANKYSNYIKAVNNHVYFYTEINNFTSIKFMECVEDAVKFIVNKRAELSLIGITPSLALVVHINSPGGSVFSVFAMIDRLRSLMTMHGIEYHSIIEGRAASAGTLLSVTANKRFITKHGYMLIHQLSTYFVGKYNEICDDKSNADELMKRIKEIYVEHATIPEHRLEEILKHDLYWNARKCLRYGLTDEIL